MPHFPKPYFRPHRNCWYVQIQGREHTLGSDRDDAFARYHALMTKAKEAPVVSSACVDDLVVVLVDRFLDWCEKHRNPHTYRWYKDRLQSFCKSIPAELTVQRLKPHHVQTWIDRYPVAIADGSRRNLIAAVKRAMKWSEELGHIDRSPIAHMKKPGCGRKELVITAQQFQALLDRSDQEFKDLLTVTWETGCRPQESLRVEACQVDLAGERWVFPASKSKGKKAPRVVYMTPTAMTIVRRLIETHPDGPLFRNENGAPWTTDAVNCRFSRARKKLGVRPSLYAIRHTWINRMLLGGVDAFTVAHLAGHSDPSMLSKHYAHLCQAPDYLKSQLTKAS